MIVDWTYGAIAHLQRYFDGNYCSTEICVTQQASGLVSADVTVAGPNVGVTVKGPGVGFTGTGTNVTFTAS